jgi:hypothetical protein
MSFTISDNDNEPILIESTGIYNFKVVWRTITKKFSNPLYGALKEDDFTSIKNFQIGDMRGLTLMIGENSYNIMHEPVDIRNITDKNGYPIKFEISGPTGKRRLYATWQVAQGFDRVSSCSVSDYTKTDDVEFIKILCNPQDYPHGVLVSIDGYETEALNEGRSTRYESSETQEQRELDEYYKNYMWQTIKSELETDNDVETTLKILEHSRLINILENKDSLNLAREIDKQNSIIKQLTIDLTSAKESLATQIEENKSLVSNQEKLQKENKIYKDERITFAKDLAQKLSEVLKQSTLV